MLNTKTKNLIEQRLENLHRIPSYNLSSSERFEIYKSFGSSRLLDPNYPTSEEASIELTKLSFADYAVGWLAVLTVEHNLPMWNQANFDKVPEFEGDLAITPNHIIQMARDVLQHTINSEIAFQAFHDVFHYSSSRFEKYITYNIYCLYKSSCSSLEQILFGRSIEYEDYTIDNKMRLAGDFVTEALLASSLIDNNEPGHWRSFSNNLSLLPSLEIDVQKRLEFWEWWLTEAIPQAWELAQQSSSS